MRPGQETSSRGEDRGDRFRISRCTSKWILVVGSERQDTFSNRECIPLHSTIELIEMLQHWLLGMARRERRGERSGFLCERDGDATTACTLLLWLIRAVQYAEDQQQHEEGYVGTV